jgi:hypothetical protein
VWHKQILSIRGQSWQDQRPKSHVVKDQNLFGRGLVWTAGYQPAMSAKREHLSCGSPHGSKGERLKNYAARSAGLKPSCGFVLFSVVSWLREKTVTTKSHEQTRNDAEADPNSGLSLSPLLRAGFCNNRLKNPVATAPGSDHENADLLRPATIYEPRTSCPPSAFRR